MRGCTLNGMPSEPKAKPIPLPDLIARLTELDGLSGVERAKLARELAATSGPTIVSIRAAGDEGVWQATRGAATYDEVAADIGLGPNSRSKVADAVSRHNARRRSVD